MCPGGTATPWVAAALRSWLSKAWGGSKKRRALLTWPGWPQLAWATKGTTLQPQRCGSWASTCPVPRAWGPKKRERGIPFPVLSSCHFTSGARSEVLHPCTAKSLFGFCPIQFQQPLDHVLKTEKGLCLVTRVRSEIRNYQHRDPQTGIPNRGKILEFSFHAFPFPWLRADLANLSTIQIRTLS